MGRDRAAWAADEGQVPMDSEWLRLILAVLATWRMSRLVAFEDGPWDAVARLRRLAGDGMLGHLMDCPYCLSLWFAAPAALSLDQAMPGWVVTWLGVSGGASLLERVAGPGNDVVVTPVAPVASPTPGPGSTVSHFTADGQPTILAGPR